jgi:hypothetical protein
MIFLLLAVFILVHLGGWMNIYTLAANWKNGLSAIRCIADVKL